MPALLVLGHANIDVQLQLKGLPGPSESQPVQTRRTVYGGTAANVAIHAASLGVPTTLWARVGADFPADWRARLEASGLTLALDEDAARGTPTCFILTDADGNQAYCMDQGAMGVMTENPPSAELLAGLVAGDWLHICTGSPGAYMDLAKSARAKGIKVALDPGQELRFAYSPKTFEKLLDLCDLLFVNAFELDIACKYMSYGDPVQFLDHVDNIVVTHGDKGATLYGAGKPIHADALPVSSILDPTGAGDAFRAGWYAGLHARHSMETALRWAVAAGAVAVQHEGPQEHLVQPAELSTLV